MTPFSPRGFRAALFDERSELFVRGVHANRMTGLAGELVRECPASEIAGLDKEGNSYECVFGRIEKVAR